MQDRTLYLTDQNFQSDSDITRQGPYVMMGNAGIRELQTRLFGPDLGMETLLDLMIFNLRARGCGGVSHGTARESR